MTHSKIVLADGVKPLDAPVKLDQKKRASAEVVVAQTEGGKDVLIRRGPIGKGFVVAYSGGGELPSEMAGLWLRFEDALNAVRGYAGRAGSPVVDVIKDINGTTVPGIG